MKVSTLAPTRIDLAGGTVDLWPLYLFFERASTINLGINLFAEASLELLPAGSTPPPELRNLISQERLSAGVLLCSQDQKGELALPWSALIDNPKGEKQDGVPPHLVLHFRLLKRWLEFRSYRSSGLRDQCLILSTRAQSPAGAGLGGSSTLSIAILGCLQAWTENTPVNPQSNPELATQLIEFARDVETTVIQVPAGMQDYYGAMFGGLQQIKWNPGSHASRQLPIADATEWRERVQLYYSGQSRQSGINNWVLFKKLIDGDRGVRNTFSQIVEATHDLETALLKKDWTQIAQAVGAEWDARKALAEGISTPEIDKAFSLLHSRFPNSRGKICGAGGGGCFFFLHGGEIPSPQQKRELNQELDQMGIRALPFEVSPQGLQTRLTESPHLGGP
jgi:D-glycero-alpha-D-manno-heptose-7-phosphate kinase